MKKEWYMCTWTLISHITGLGTRLLHYWLLKYNICQHWESKYQKFSLDCPFPQKAQIFPQRSVQPCFKIWAVVRKWSHHPPPVSCADFLGKGSNTGGKKMLFQYQAPPASYTQLCPRGHPGRAIWAPRPCPWAKQEQYPCRRWWQSHPLLPTPSALSHPQLMMALPTMCCGCWWATWMVKDSQLVKPPAYIRDPVMQDDWGVLSRSSEVKKLHIPFSFGEYPWVSLSLLGLCVESL